MAIYPMALLTWITHAAVCSYSICIIASCVDEESKLMFQPAAAVVFDEAIRLDCQL